jgi:hypothetical protein
MQIERAERAAIHLFVAGVGVAMMGVAGPLASPDAPKIFWQVIVFAGGLLTAASATFMIYEYRDLMKRGRMIPLLGMLVSGVLFVGFAGWYFWPHRNTETSANDEPLAGNVFFQCQLDFLPNVFPASGKINVVNFSPQDKNWLKEAETLLFLSNLEFPAKR